MNSSEQAGDYLLSSPRALETIYNGGVPTIADIARPDFWQRLHTPLPETKIYCLEGKIDIFRILTYLSKRHLATKHSKLYIRTEKFEEWQVLRGGTSTLPILAASAKSHSMPSRHRLLMPLIAKNKIYSINKGFSESHLHIGAYTYAEEQWLIALHQPSRASAAISSIIKAHGSIFMVKPFAHDSERLCRSLQTARTIRENLIATLSVNRDAESLQSCLFDIVSATEKQFRGVLDAECMIDFAGCGLADFWGSESRMWLQAFAAVKQYESCRSLLAALLHFYLLLENDISLYFRGEIGSKGLVNLKPIYGIHLQMPEEAQYESSMYRRLKEDTHFSGFNQVEVRLSRSALNRFYQKRKTLVPFNETLVDSPSVINSFHTAVHLVKSAYGKNAKAKSLAKMMKDCRDEAANLSPYLKTEKYQFLRLDAAGATLDVPAETLAPAYRYHSGKIKGKTIHCGEDFRHLISGIREVADSIRFLCLDKGDRIGHAVSIGIDPQKWIGSQSNRIKIPQHEWLMNLIYLIEATEQDFPTSIGAWQLRAARLQWETDALVLARALFPDCQELQQADALQLLYRLHENYHLYAPYLEPDSPEEICGLDETERLLIERAHLATTAGLRNLLAEWNTIRPAEQTCIDIPRDYIPPAVIIKLQQQVQQTIKKKGLVVEVCLISNYRISIYRSLMEHHIFRWLHLQGCTPAGDSRMKLCIGCDDPGIFITNTANEYYQLICLLRRRGLSSRVIRRIINRLIEQGNRTLIGK